MGKLIKWVFPIKQHYAKITERERRQYIQDHQEERKKRDWKTKRKGLEKRVWMCEVVGAYREIFSDVGDLFLGLLGNPKAPNFRQSFLHFSSFLLAFSVPQSSLKVSLTTQPDWKMKKKNASVNLSPSVCSVQCACDRKTE